MTTPWIKMCVDLSTKREVIALARALGSNEDAIVGKLHRLWAWADANTKDGNVEGVTGQWIDRYLDAPNFARNLAKVGWIRIRRSSVFFPNFERHMSKSAKTRAVTASRVSKHRNAATVTGPLPEKRREEKTIKDPPNPPRGTTYTPGFLAFWREYPRKVGKGAAFRAYQKRGGVDVALLVAAVQSQRAGPDWIRDNGQYVPNPATWLNQRRWEDEPPEKVNGPAICGHDGCPYKLTTDEGIAAGLCKRHREVVA